jgi:hypothetical protein
MMFHHVPGSMFMFIYYQHDVHVGVGVGVLGLLYIVVDGDGMVSMVGMMVGMMDNGEHDGCEHGGWWGC